MNVCPEAATKSVLCKKMFLEISQNSQENTCTRVSFLIKACNFIKKETLAQVFSWEFCEIFKNIFFTEHLWTTASSSAFYFSRMFPDPLSKYLKNMKPHFIFNLSLQTLQVTFKKKHKYLCFLFESLWLRKERAGLKRGC